MMIKAFVLATALFPNSDDIASKSQYVGGHITLAATLDTNGLVGRPEGLGSSGPTKEEFETASHICNYMNRQGFTLGRSEVRRQNPSLTEYFQDKKTAKQTCKSLGKKLTGWALRY